MNRPTFLKLLARDLFPELRATGFKGSGTTLRRIHGPVVHVVNIQGSTGSAGCYVNLGASLTFLRMHGLDETNADSAKESNCEFRTRLDPPNRARQHWPYGLTKVEIEGTLAEMRFAWQRDALPWFAKYHTYPDDFEPLVFDDLAMACHPAHALALARIALHIGHATRAVTIVRAAFSRTPEGASVLRQELQLLLNRAA